MKRLSVNALSVESINEAVRELREYQRQLQEKARRILRVVAGVGEKIARERFNSPAVDVHIEFDDDFHCRLVASGGEIVCFLEFGTGTLVDTGEKYASAVPIKVEPGSWSKEHGHTYEDWVKGGMVGEYRYNTEPTRAMYHAYEAMYQAVEQAAREVLNR